MNTTPQDIIRISTEDHPTVPSGYTCLTIKQACDRAWEKRHGKKGDGYRYKNFLYGKKGRNKE